MNPDNSETLDEAKAALDQAREAHAAAMLSRHSAPSNPDAQRRVQDAVQQGKAAWKAYQAAATEGLAAQIEGIVPTNFRRTDPAR